MQSIPFDKNRVRSLGQTMLFEGTKKELGSPMLVFATFKDYEVGSC